MTDAEDKYPSTIYSIRKNMGLEDDTDTSKDDEIMKMSREAKFRRFMTWQGIIGYEGIIKNAIEEIYEVELREEP